MERIRTLAELPFRLLLSILFRFEYDPEIPTKAPDELCRHLIERIRAAVRVGSLSH